MNNELLTPKETADWLRTSPGSLANMRYHADGPPFIRIGRRVLYDREEVAKWLDRHRVRTIG
jgi:predicted DNA-binding transcriptional regulator AlpA